MKSVCSNTILNGLVGVLCGAAFFVVSVAGVYAEDTSFERQEIDKRSIVAPTFPAAEEVTEQNEDDEVSDENEEENDASAGDSEGADEKSDSESDEEKDEEAEESDGESDEETDAKKITAPTLPVADEDDSADDSDAVAEDSDADTAVVTAEEVSVTIVPATDSDDGAEESVETAVSDEASAVSEINTFGDEVVYYHPVTGEIISQQEMIAQIQMQIAVLRTQIQKHLDAEAKKEEAEKKSASVKITVVDPSKDVGFSEPKFSHGVKKKHYGAEDEFKGLAFPKYRRMTNCYRAGIQAPTFPAFEERIAAEEAAGKEAAADSHSKKRYLHPETGEMVCEEEMVAYLREKIVEVTARISALVEARGGSAVDQAVLLTAPTARTDGKPVAPTLPFDADPVVPVVTDTATGVAAPVATEPITHPISDSAIDSLPEPYVPTDAASAIDSALAGDTVSAAVDSSDVETIAPAGEIDAREDIEEFLSTVGDSDNEADGSASATTEKDDAEKDSEGLSGSLITILLLILFLIIIAATPTVVQYLKRRKERNTNSF